jgi:hypothetical protein
MIFDIESLENLKNNSVSGVESLPRLTRLDSEIAMMKCDQSKLVLCDRIWMPKSRSSNHYRRYSYKITEHGRSANYSAN